MSSPEGLVQVSDVISVERLLEAYSFGIYPWPMEGYPILWFSPPERGVLDFSEFHIPRSLLKWLKSHPLRFTWNTKFKTVIENCQKAPRPGQSGTWITPKLKKAYIDFHKAGYAHSLEAWRDGELVGGLYGVYVAGVFCGESMFFKETNASKACLVYLVETLRERGVGWMDTQMVTPTIELFGGKNISRAEFLERLEKAKAAPVAELF